MNATAQTAGRIPATQGAESSPSAQSPRRRLSKKQLLLIGVGVWLGGTIALIAIYGFKGTRNKVYEPQNEFKLENWVDLGIFSLNKAVLYLFLAAGLTCVSMIYVPEKSKKKNLKMKNSKDYQTE